MSNLIKVKNEGAYITDGASTLDFAGSGVSASYRDGGFVTVTIPDAPFSGNQVAPDITDGNVFMAVYVQTVASETNWFYFMQNTKTPTRGAKVTMKKNQNVFAVYSIEEGELRPAYYFPYASDANAGTATGTLSNTNYYVFDDPTDYRQWTAPAAANGMDRIVVYYVSHNTNGGLMEILVNGVSVGTVDTAAGSVVSRLEATISLTTPLATNDLIRFRTTATETLDVRMQGFWVYKSTGTCVAGDQRMVLAPLTQLTAAGSSMEFAYSIAPTGSAVKWIGGYTHQGGANATQVSVSESFTDDGSSFSLAQGYRAGLIKWTKSSTARYDATPTDIGTITEIYYLTGNQIIYASTFTTTAAIDTDVRYVAQLPANVASTYWVVDDMMTFDIDGISAPNFFYVPAGARKARIGGGMNNTRNVMIMNSDPPARQHFLWDNSNAIHKIYWSLENSIVNLASGSKWSGGWTYWLETDS